MKIIDNQSSYEAEWWKQIDLTLNLYPFVLHVDLESLIEGDKGYFRDKGFKVLWTYGKSL